jgi:hypothetical protein
VTQLLFMDFDGGNQQCPIVGPFVINFKIDDDLILRFLNLHHLAEFGGLARLAFPNGFRAGLEHAEQLAFIVRIPVEHPCFGLPHQLLNTSGHGVQLSAQPFQGCLPQDIGGLLHAAGDFFGEPLGLPHHSAGRGQQLFVRLLQLVLTLFAFAARRPRDLQHPQLHADNGSEYINYMVARLLEELLVEFTKSRANRSQDNALVEGKNRAIIRKLIGYGYIGGEHAEARTFYLQIAERAILVSHTGVTTGVTTGAG